MSFYRQIIGEYMDKYIGKKSFDKPVKSAVDIREGVKSANCDSGEERFTAENYKNNQMAGDGSVVREQYIRDSMKLGIALQLKLEGYETVAFNRVVEGERGSFVLDVFAEGRPHHTIFKKLSKYLNVKSCFHSSFNLSKRNNVSQRFARSNVSSSLLFRNIIIIS